MMKIKRGLAVAARVVLLSQALIPLFFLLPFTLFAQKAGQFNLAQLLTKNKISVFNRTIKAVADTTGAVYLDEKANEGVAWLRGVNFSEGTIEVDLKGKDVFQKSFLGIAFHGKNDSTYDAVYFRPFNFRTTDSVRRIHAVQYISHPNYPWKKLRDEQNGKYEKAVNPVPNPNRWFHATISVKNDQVQVFVNHSKKPSLTVKKLNTNNAGTLGLWVGDGAGGTFANLSITRKEE